MAGTRDHGLDELLEAEQSRDHEFRAEWVRLAPARQFAAMLVGYRADHGLSQRALAQLLGVSQPRIVRMESGEQNPDFETIIGVVSRLGTEFVLDVAPGGFDARFVTKSARAAGSVAQRADVAVITASAQPHKNESRRPTQRSRRGRVPEPAWHSGER